jgi:hypothetical protein
MLVTPVPPVLSALSAALFVSAARVAGAIHQGLLTSTSHRSGLLATSSSKLLSVSVTTSVPLQVSGHAPSTPEDTSEIS